jgi:hypothetical protein
VPSSSIVVGSGVGDGDGEPPGAKMSVGLPTGTSLTPGRAAAPPTGGDVVNAVPGPAGDGPDGADMPDDDDPDDEPDEFDEDEPDDRGDELRGVLVAAGRLARCRGSVVRTDETPATAREESELSA